MFSARAASAAHVRARRCWDLRGRGAGCVRPASAEKPFNNGGGSFNGAADSPPENPMFFVTKPRPPTVKTPGTNPL